MSRNLAHLSRDASEGYIQVMERVGFYRNGEPTPGVIEAASLRSNDGQIDKRMKYSAVIDPKKLNATAIFELSGSPCIYFTRLDQDDPDPAVLARLYRMAWNQGLAPMLWVVTPTKVMLYNCYSKPTLTDETNPNQHLIDLFEQTEKGLQQLHNFANRLQIESGTFWQKDKAKRIDRRQRVDVTLLGNLAEAEKQLVNDGLEPSVAHALLGRSIFVAYLQDRGILTADFLRSYSNAEKFTEVLTANSTSPTYELFSWVQETFNGNLFPLIQTNGHTMHEQDLVTLDHLKVVQRLLDGADLKTGQGRLWPYDFNVIPVELISSIYEMFVHADNSQIAQERSTYYTPINLVDLVLSEVFSQLPAHANVLDLSCGSGVFLVEALRRLVARRITNGEKWSRDMVRDTLYRQIYGVDISKEAIQIAAFSLYLTALELDPDPHLSHQVKFRPLTNKNLFAADAFDENASFNKEAPFVTKSFHAIVGNPPWRRNRANRLATMYCKKHKYSITRRSLDQAFLWRIGDFASDKTHIGLILHSRPLFSHAPEALKAREELLKRFSLQVLVNLSDMRQDGLFPRADAPATVFIAKGCCSKSDDSFHFVCAEHSKTFKKHGIIEIGPENVKRISTYRVISDTDVLKVASWGNARDMALIEHLRNTFSSLGKLIHNNKYNGWVAGQGFRGSGSFEAPELYGKKWLPSGEMSPYFINLDTLETLSRQKLDRPRDPQIYKGPLVITTRGLSKAGFYSAFSQGDVVYTEEYYGIAIPQHQEYLAHYLNGVLNSSLATYFLFMTASVWGVERDKVEPNDLLRFPLPETSMNNEDLVKHVVEVEGQLLQSYNGATRESLKQQLDETVYELYGLDETERILVQDAVNLTIDLRMNREKSKAVDRPQLDELEAYATQLIGVIQPFFQALNERALVADVLDVGKAPLYVIKFSLLPLPLHRPFVQISKEEGLEAILRRIAVLLPQKIADNIYTRRILRIYVGSDFYIVKPVQRRYWSRSSGLNDADSILSEHIRSSYASIK
ncbi:MAG TPA: N-6 DNA methylase [Ktedonobacteraceae bacterium]|nr:N-6 DNA methylase [Ktedonobacteraceae bacterium]